MARMEAAPKKETDDLHIVTEADILTVSDGRSFVIAHTGDTHDFITGNVKAFAALLQIVRQMGELLSLIFHFLYCLNIECTNVVHLIEI